MRIAIIGTGIAGLGAAYALHRSHEITVFEKAERLGGHSHTLEVDYDGVRIPVDTGFIVYNERNYPNLTALFAALGVASEQSDMTFSVSVADGALEWAGENVRTLFAQRRNLFRPSFHAMWRDILKFRKRAMADLAGGTVGGVALGAYLDRHGLGQSFRRNYLLPLGGAIWSTSPADMLAFPAEPFLRFFDNHQLYAFDGPFWRTVSGGSREYVARLTAPFRDRIHAGRGVRSVRRAANGVVVEDRHGTFAEFDEVIFACHSDEAMALLADASAAERASVGQIRYAPNTAILHRDARLMPKRRRAWASWNYRCDTVPEDGALDAAPVSVTYWMNRLQNLDPARPLFVSLNPARPPAPETVFARLTYDHPQFDAAALAGQRRLAEVQGRNHTWFCGAWCGYGFHEDGLTAGLEVALRLGGCVPWGQIGEPRLFTAIADAAE